MVSLFDTIWICLLLNSVLDFVHTNSFYMTGVVTAVIRIDFVCNFPFLVLENEKSFPT